MDDLTDDQVRWLAHMSSNHYDIGCPVDPPLAPVLESLIDFHLLDYYWPEDENGHPQLVVALTDKGRAVFDAVPSVRKVRAFVKCDNYLYARWSVIGLTLEELPEFLIHKDSTIRQAAGLRLRELCNAQKVTFF